MPNRDPETPEEHVEADRQYGHVKLLVKFREIVEKSLDRNLGDTVTREQKFNASWAVIMDLSNSGFGIYRDGFDLDDEPADA